MDWPSESRSVDRRRLSEEEVTRIAAVAAQATVDALMNDSQFVHATCKFRGISEEQHVQDHKNIQEMAAFFKRANEIKWTVPKTIVTVAVSAAVIFLLKYYKIFQ